MTGRELILYILANGLEDELVGKNGGFFDFMSEVEAALKFNVGPNTIRTWIEIGALDSICIGNTYFIPADAPRPKLYIMRGD